MAFGNLFPVMVSKKIEPADDRVVNTNVIVKRMPVNVARQSTYSKSPSIAAYISRLNSVHPTSKDSV